MNKLLKEMRQLGLLLAVLTIVTAALVGSPAVVNANPNLTPGVWTDITPAAAQIGYSYGLGIFMQGVAIDPENPNVLYFADTGYNPTTGATVSGNIWKTTDAGSDWTALSPLDAPLHIRVDPHNSLHVYAVDGVRGNYAGFWVSTDGGVTWTEPAGFTTLCSNLNTAGYANFNDGYSIALDPTNANHVLYSSHNCAGVVGETTDGGNTWVSHVTPATTCTGGYFITFLYDPPLGIGNSATWLFCTQTGGVFRTSNSGSTWTLIPTANSMNHGGNQALYTSSGVLLAGGNSWPVSPQAASPMRSTDNGLTWVGPTTLPSGFDNGTMGMVDSGTTIYTGGCWGNVPIFTSPDTDAANWTICSGSPTFTSSGPFEMAYDSVNAIVYATITTNMPSPQGATDGIWAYKVPGSSGPPTAPSGLTATPGNAQVALTWNSSSGATSYSVYRGTTSGGESTTAIATGVTSTTYTNTSLTNGTTYYYTVKAFNSSGTSGASNEAGATPQLSAPPAPTGLTAGAGSGQVALSWSASSGATSYNVYRGTSSGGESSTAIVTGVTVTSYTNTGLTNGTTYYYTVKALNTGGTSGASNEASAAPTAGTGGPTVPNDSFETPSVGTDVYNPTGATWTFAGNSGIEANGSGFGAPNAPDGVQAAFLQGNHSQGTGVLGAMSVPVNFTATGSYQISFQAAQRSGQIQPIEVTVDGAQVGGDLTPTSGWSGLTSASFTISTTGNHTIGLAATDNSGDKTSFVDLVTIASAGGGSAPPAPTGLTAAPGNTQVVLAWTASSGATSYNVLRSTVSGSGYASVTTGVTGTSYTNTGLTNGTTYYYVVTAVNSAGTSADSAQASATPTAGSPPPAPTGLAAIATDTQNALTWSASSGATSYNVYRGTTAGGESSTAIATGITVTNYTNTGLTDGATYFYTVKAVNAAGTSGASNEANGEPCEYNFESGIQGWTFTAPATAVAQSTTQVYGPTHSLAVTINGAAGNAYAYIATPSTPAGKVITFHFWIPTGSQLTGVQPYVMDQNWTWTGNYQAIGSLTAGAWNTLQVTVPSNAVLPLQQLGVQFITGATWSGTCYVDSISW